MDLVAPPLLSESRQSLRERCGTSLTILTTSYREWNRVCHCDCELDLFMIPKRKRTVELLEEEEELLDEEEDVDEVEELNEDEDEEEDELDDEDDEDDYDDQVEEEEEQGEEDDYYDEVHQIPPPSPTPSLEEDNVELEEVNEDEDELEDEGEEGEEELELENVGDEDYYDGQAHQIPPPSPTPSLEECNHILEIKQGLYIALVDDEADLAALRTFDLKPFTHLVQVSYAMPIGNEPPPPSPTPLMRRLHIVCPAASLHLRADQTAVDLLQLGVARDFLAVALPHGSAKWWPEEQRKIGKVGEWRENRHVQDEQDIDADAQFVVLAPGGPDEFQNEQDEPELQDDMDINALIVAPTSRAVDVVSILYCYLAFLEDTTAENLTLAYYYDRVWAGATLGRWTMDQVNLMAGSV